MPTYSDEFSSGKGTLYIDVSNVSPNTANNTSVVSFTLRVVGNNASWNFDNGSYRITVDGQNYTGSWDYDFRADNTVTLRTGSKTITHLTNGTKSVVVSGTATDAGGSPLGTATIGNKTFVLDPLPGTPTSGPTLSRNSAGTEITIVSQTSGTNAAVTDYEYANTATPSTVVSMGTDATIVASSLTPTTTYSYQTRVKTADGSGPWSAATSIVGLPFPPASISATLVNKNVVVVAGSSSGTGVTSYFAQYSSNSGSTWSTAVTMTSQSHTFTSLTPGQTYLFRVYSTNSIGNSGFSTSSPVFIPAGGKRWDGSTWNPNLTAKRWDGSAWVDISTAKRWTGSAWENVS